MDKMVTLQQIYYLKQDKQLQGHQRQEGQLQVHNQVRKHRIQQQVQQHQQHQLLAQEQQ